MSDIERLERELKIAKDIQEIHDFFSESRCPVCGNKSIKASISISGGESMMSGLGSVECDSCRMFVCKEPINGYDAYHWRSDGTSELDMLRTLRRRTEQYLKVEE